jgi:biopolymer transport protein ExbB
MVKAFAGIGDLGGRVDPSILAGGIWEALLTTVAGLAVAIPALITHYVVDSRIDKVHGKVHDLVSELWTYHDKA